MSSKESYGKSETDIKPPKPYKLDTLPIEVIGHIFSNLSFEECQRLTLVSRSFNYAVAAWQGIHVRITDSNWNYILWNSDSYISAATLASFHHRLNFINDPLTTSFVENLRYLEFSKWNQKLNFVRILQHATNLETLIFGEPVLEDIDGQEDNFKMTKSFKFDLSNLKVLKLMFGLFGSERNHQFRSHLTVFLDLLKNILKESEVKLTFLRVSSCYSPIAFMLYSGIFGEPLGDFVNSMFPGVMSIRDIFLQNRATLETVILEEKLRSTDESVINGPITLKLWPSDSKMVENDVQLKEIDLRNINLSCKFMEAHFLSYILVKQYNLRKLVNRSAHNSSWNTVNKTVQLNCHSLTTIFFDYTELAKNTAPSLQPLSASIFKNCSGLRNLTLFQDHKYSRHTSLPLMQLFDVHRLPKSIRNFSTSLTLCFQVSDFLSINFDNFEKLEKFELLSTPWFWFNSNTLKIMKVEHFLHILKSMPSLQRINIMTKPLPIPKTAEGRPGEPIHTNEDLNVTRNLIEFVQNDYGLRYDSRRWKRQMYDFEYHRKLEIMILPVFRRRFTDLRRRRYKPVTD